MKNLTQVWLVITCLTIGFGFAQENKTLENTTKNETSKKDLNKNIHLVAQASTNEIAVDGEIEIEYRLYVSPDIGISSWELVEKPTYEGFYYENVTLENLKIENTTYEGKSYRMVMIKKDIIKAIKSGDYKVKPLQLQINVEVADTNNTKDGFNLSIKQVVETVLSNSLKVNVKS